MTDITVNRISEILRLVFDLLWFEPQGLYVSEIMRYIQATVPLSEYETGYYAYAPYSPRYEVVIRVGTIPLVRAGWLEKTKNGRWFITEAGREACKRYKNAADFFEESVRLFVQWKSNENTRLVQLGANPYNFAVENSWEQIRQYIDNLDMRDLREMVSVLLKAMGCYIAWSGPIGEDNELIDLICYMDPLGLNTSRIVVHVANKSQVSTRDGLSAFMNVLKPNDVGLYISLGGSTNDLNRFALTQTQHRVRLIDLETFVDLWVEHQSKIDQESRIRFPLKPVYFLAFPNQG
ncbi:MAG TPA: restriction endonuclease [Anaerolineales bacterium]|jgi:restriction system protein